MALLGGTRAQRTAKKPINPDQLLELLGELAPR
jgi:hypothetical protein